MFVLCWGPKWQGNPTHEDKEGPWALIRESLGIFSPSPPFGGGILCVWCIYPPSHLEENTYTGHIVYLLQIVDLEIKFLSPTIFTLPSFPQPNTLFSHIFSSPLSSTIKWTLSFDIFRRGKWIGLLLPCSWRERERESSGNWIMEHMFIKRIEQGYYRISWWQLHRECRK